MWANYLKVIFRILLRNRFFSLINILGLSTGITTFLFIVLFLRYEFSFDKHFTNSDLIYRVTLDMIWDQAPTQYTALAPAAAAHQLAMDYPQILAGTRFIFIDRHMFDYSPDYGNQVLEPRRFYENNIMLADSNFLRVFDLQIIAGKKETILTFPNSILISETIAKKYFHNENPLGKTLRMDNQTNYVVRGIMEDIPDNTHFQTDFILSAVGDPLFDIDNWIDFSYGYIRVDETFDANSFDQQLVDFKEKYYAPWKDGSNFRLQKLVDIHLRNDRIFDFAKTRDIGYLHLMAAIAILIILIACINYMNLSTARSIYRSKEVKIRKVAGADRLTLITQFLGETVSIAFLSMIISLIVIEILQPWFLKLTETHVAFDYGKDWVYVLVLTLGLGVIAGLYPALFMSSFSPSNLKTSLPYKNLGNVQLRKILVIFQFVVMVILLSGSGIIFLQMRLIKTKSLGFDKELIVYTSIDNDDSGKLPHRMKEKLETYSNIEGVCVSNYLPGETPWGDHFKIEGSDDFFPSRTANIGYEFIPTLGMKMVAGRNFSRSFGSDSTGCIINETAMKKFGWTPDNTIGKKINWNFAQNRDDEIHGHVVGVVEDFHFKSLHEKVEPIVLTIINPYNNFITAKINSSNIEETLRFIELTHHELNPGFPFEYTFLDKDYERLYEGERLFEKIFKYFVGLAIFIACLGLLGLSMFLAERKFKEIGIRKTMGASVFQIVQLLTRNFSFWVLLANIIGWPIAWYIMDRWLDNFAYRIDISFFTFLAVGIITQFIAMVTVGALAYNAARKNPVEAIRYE